MKGRPYQKGQSGNPGGRTKAEVAVSRLVPRLIADLTNNCADLVHLLLRIAAGAEPGMTDPKSRAFAIRELLDRGAGKAPLKIELGPAEDRPVLDDRDLSDEELEVLAKMDEAQPGRVLRLVPPEPVTADVIETTAEERTGTGAEERTGDDCSSAS